MNTVAPLNSCLAHREYAMQECSENMTRHQVDSDVTILLPILLLLPFYYHSSTIAKVTIAIVTLAIVLL